MTNREKFIECFGYDGSIVSNVRPSQIKYQTGSCGYPTCNETCASRCYPRCPHWWEDEFSDKNRVWMIRNENGEYLTLKAGSINELPKNFSRSKFHEPMMTVSATEISYDPFEDIITVGEYYESLREQNNDPN